jgi:hypothetical protein
MFHRIKRRALILWIECLVTEDGIFHEALHLSDEGLLVEEVVVLDHQLRTPSQ